MGLSKKDRNTARKLRSRAWSGKPLSADQYRTLLGIRRKEVQEERKVNPLFAKKKPK